MISKYDDLVYNLKYGVTKLEYFVDKLMPNYSVKITVDDDSCNEKYVVFQVRDVKVGHIINLNYASDSELCECINRIKHHIDEEIVSSYVRGAL